MWEVWPQVGNFGERFEESVRDDEIAP